MNKEFEVHMLNNMGKSKAGDIAKAFDILLETIKAECQGSAREFAIVKTKLEEACFFAKKAMANVMENQMNPTEGLVGEQK